MSYPDPSYFLTLAQIAIAFVAFTSLVVVLRQARGGALTAYERVSMTFNIEVGFAVLWFAMLPALFGLSGDYGAREWRVLAGVFGAFVFVWLTLYLRRRRRVLRAAIPSRMLVFVASNFAMAGALLADAAGFRIEGLSTYALAVTWSLAGSCVGFLLTLPAYFEDAPMGDGDVDGE